MRANRAKIGTRVMIAKTSIYYKCEEDLFNPRDMEGTIRQFYTSSQGLCVSVMWDNGHTNVYGYKDLKEVVKKPTPKTRIIMSIKELSEDNDSKSFICVADVEDVLNLPKEVLSFGIFMEGTNLKDAFSISSDPYAAFRKTTEYPHIYTMVGEAVYKLVSKPSIESCKHTKQLEIGAVYRVTKGVCGDISEGAIVTLLEQEPEEYQGDLPYRVLKVNTKIGSWVNSDLEFEKV